MLTPGMTKSVAGLGFGPRFHAPEACILPLDEPAIEPNLNTKNLQNYARITFMNDSLVQKKCIPCKIGTPPMGIKQVKQMIEKINDWNFIEDNIKGMLIYKIQKDLKFKDFKEAMGFVNKVADIAEAEGHHPNIFISYNKVRLTLWTHASSGLTENDFILAAKIDQAKN